MVAEVIPGRIENFTRIWGAPEGWDEAVDGPCCGLAVREQGGVLASVWEPTPAELERLNAGAPVYLFIAGTVQPPVGIEVGYAADDAEALKEAA